MPPALRGLLLLGPLLSVASLSLAPLDAGERPSGPSRRGPVALAVSGRTLFIANEGTGTISTLSLETLAVGPEHPVGRSLRALASVAAAGTSARPPRLLAVDGVGDEALLLEPRGESLLLRARCSLPRGAASLALTPDGALAVVGSTWARTLTYLSTLAAGTEAAEAQAAGSEVVGTATLTWVRTVDLPVAPGKLWLDVRRQLLVVAAAFGRDLLVLDLPSGRLVHSWTLDGHNLGGLAPSPDGKALLVAHQTLNERESTTESSVFWGTVMGNLVRSLDLETLTSEEPPASAVVDDWFLRDAYPLGEPGNAAGDPGAILVTAEGHTLVCLGGVHAVALRFPPTAPFQRLRVGKGPAALALDPASPRVFVANRFDDTISVLELAERKVTATVSLGPMREPALAERGEALFFDATLSLDGWYSCHSCHTDGHSSGLLNDNFGDGSFGTPKRIPSLLGGGETRPWGWTGQKRTLEEQIAKSIHVTMQGKSGETLLEQQAEALAAYVRTLAPAPSLASARRGAARGASELSAADLAAADASAADSPGAPTAFDRGAKVFGQRDCARCHRPPLYTTPETYDVGLSDEKRAHRFNPPSLLGVSQRVPLLHDGRASSLRDLLERLRHPEGESMDPGDLEDLLAFLGGL